jgi:hypothetical protein
MKPYKIIIATLVIGLLSLSGVSSAEETAPDYVQFTGIVSEWTSYGQTIQVDDHTITEIRSVWLDNGGKEMLEVNTGYIKLGAPVRVVLEKQDTNGFWIAHKIIVFEGKGLEAAIKHIPPYKREGL